MTINTNTLRQLASWLSSQIGVFMTHKYMVPPNATPEELISIADSIDSALLQQGAQPRYQYHMFTWGKFYDPTNIAIHSEKPGDHVFNTIEERETYIATLHATKNALKIEDLMIVRTEGFCCNIRTIIHRVVEYRGQMIYSSLDLGVNYPIGNAVNYMNFWQPGKEDFPLGPDHDYAKDPPKTIREWVSGVVPLERMGNQQPPPGISEPPTEAPPSTNNINYA